MTQPIRILIADDHPVVRDGLSAILGTQADFAVVGEAANGQELIAQAAALRPDVILTDLEMPGLDGLDAIRQIHEAQPAAQIIVLTAYNTDDRIIGSIRAGAQGYLLKGAPRHEIFEAIRVISRGGTLLHPIAAARLIEHIRAPEAAPEALTEREREVLRLLAQGKANKEIAAALDITERTVKFHVSAIIAKLGAGNRTEAVTLAVQRGLLTL